MHFPTASAPLTEQESRTKFLEPFKMPAVEAGEEQIEYVCAVKPTAAFEYCTLGGLNFDKRILPSDASLLNSNKTYEYGVPCFLLTKKQVDALLARAKQVQIVIPTKPNPAWRLDRTEEKEYIQGYTVLVSDWIILQKKSEYSLDPTHKYNFQEKEAEKIEQEKALGEALIDQQAKPDRKKK